MFFVLLEPLHDRIQEYNIFLRTMDNYDVSISIYKYIVILKFPRNAQFFFKMMLALTCIKANEQT